MEQSIENFIDILHRVHCDNSKQQYYAKRPREAQRSMMPMASFVYEYFLFNSLYQVDWKKSYAEGGLRFHLDDCSESKQQREFVKFIKVRAKEKPSDLYRAFEPLAYLPKTVGEWTKVTTDTRITTEEGERFFDSIRELQEIIENCDVPGNMPATKKVFKLIDKELYFIYLVRNNIFHGSKTLGEINNPYQKRRIEVYDLFLKGVTSLFFLVVGKTEVASDFVPLPISSQSLPISQDREIIEMLDLNTVWKSLNRKLMKVGDSRLITHFTKQVTPPKEILNQRSSALFYPSSGPDLLTPLLLGLPYCTQFYFYEREQDRHPPQVDIILRKIPTVSFNNQARQLRWKHQDNYHHLEFSYDGIPRKIYWCHSDNLEFLKVDVDLAFYFHRGDSKGEGGSGQKWDSELLPELIKKIPVGKPCIFLTDGEPGGVDELYFDSQKKLDIPFLERDREYYFGSLFNPGND